MIYGHMKKDSYGGSLGSVRCSDYSQTGQRDEGRCPGSYKSMVLTPDSCPYRQQEMERVVRSAQHRLLNHVGAKKIK